LFATALAAMYSFTGAEVQRPPSDPAKITGNLGAFLLFVGIVIFAYNRLRPKDGSWGRAKYGDWLLLGVLFLLVVTGAVMEVARYAGAASVAYSTYLVHLVIVFAAFVYAPYGKLAHVFYRTAALTFMRYSGPADAIRVADLIRIKALTQAVALAALIGLLAWHTISWHSDGTHGELFDAIGDTPLDTLKGVGYNIGVMAAAGVLLGLTMERITELAGYRVKKIEHFEGGDESPTEE